jgi:cyclic beta-1,2-glucan synthetase
VLAAHDLGYINTLTLVLRLRSAFDTLAQLEQFRGHILNWFDTQNLSTLTPAYVSTVDSGNLAAALVALQQGCLQLPHQPLLRWELWQGLRDALALLVDEIHAVEPEEGDDAAQGHAARRDLLAQVDGWLATIDAACDQPQSWLPMVDRLLHTERAKLDRAVLAFVETHPEALDSERLLTLRTYSVMLHRQLGNLQHELNLLAPWQRIIDPPPRGLEDAALSDPVIQDWLQLRSRLSPNPTLVEAEAGYRDALELVPRVHAVLASRAEGAADRPGGAQGSSRAELEEAVVWIEQLLEALRATQATVQALTADLAAIAQDAARCVAEMDFSFLFDAQRKLFYIGYNVTSARYDANYYDLLASEARLASLIAIAKYDVPQSHWLRIGRPFTLLHGQPVLLSWSGTMFEYLMPLLLARSYPGTLLHESCLAAVARQRRHGQEHHVPWGVSESGFYQFDSALNYQYRAFGVPGLGLKRGLDEDLVITPYASLMAVGLAPEAVLHNLARLQADQLQGRYGLYEAADYTERRLPLGQKKGIVRSYMAHHQGMILLALANYLQEARMVRRFHADPAIQSVELLLQEQVPLAPPVDALTQTQATAPLHIGTPAPSAQPWHVPVESPLPLAHLLANGRFTTVITNSGAGYSTWNTMALTRWRPDPTLDDWGVWVYLQDMATGEVWSVGRRPVGAAVEGEEVLFYPHMAEFRHRRGPLGVQMEVTIAPDADVEIRRITLTNSGDEPQRLRLTSYGEVVLGDGAADLRHPAFAKLFVESEYLAQYNALLFRRRPRAATERPRVMAHALITPGMERTGAYESDRARFLGRGGSARRPAALHGPEWLSGVTGATLDPVMALGEELEIAPHSRVELALLTVAGESRQEVRNILARFQTWTTLALAFAAARSQADQLWREQDLAADDLVVFDQMLSLLLYPHAAGRADPAILAQNRLGQSALWAFGISGDYPIVLVQLRQAEQGVLLRRLIQAHRYWRRRGLMIDLVIANEEETNYGQALHGEIWRLLQRMEVDQALNQRGGIFLVRRDQMRPEEYTLLQTVARVVLHAERGPLEEQLAALAETSIPLPDLIAALPPEANAGPMPPLLRPQGLQFDNGWGGFYAEQREYVIYLEPGRMTPAPWINVIANPEFGFLASESGGGYSWAANSGENRLTAWRNDPVSDLPSEAIYVRDEETGAVWSPMPLPAPAQAAYLVRHGTGYTSYEHHSHGLAQEVRLYAAPDAAVKFIHIRLRNHLSRGRRLTVTFYAEWVLGVNRALTAPTIVPEVSGDGSPALLATNPYQSEFAARCAFVATNRPVHGFTADRAEFLGRAGDYASPAALRRVGLSNQVQPGQDPCAVLQVHVDLPADAEEEFIFVLGQGRDAAEARDMVQRYATLDAAQAAWQATAATWQQVLDTVQVETPEPSIDLLLNHWLLYQALACRIWGRSALYQSSGAYGFRDQLQDVMALIHAQPEVVRAQLLRAAHHQFEAGDVLHWWHPPSGRGVRTRISDDLLWLPYVTAHYVAATGDIGVLEEAIPFLQGDPLRPSEEERYAEYPTGSQTATLYEHCLRAFAKGSTHGPHGLPLMGAGDWNDGMNRVGIEGEGESIWLGWFLYAAQTAFADLADAVQRPEDAQRLRGRAAELRQALEAHGWDGEWYLRAYYDDGSPLGSAQNQECRIDSIAQSWAVLSGAGDAARSRKAMDAVRTHLVKEDARLILLFTPPFNRTRRDPGYIKGYLPGVRENGGQYTHAALWSIWAWAKLGDGDLAQSLFQMINPIVRADSAAKAEVYKVEPYVISADVYGVAPHVGRGGWTWYTGSSGWMYRLGIEAILGLRRDADSLWLEPCIPAHWPGFKLSYRLGRTRYCFTVENPEGVQCGDATVSVDGNPLPTGRVPLVDDGQEHQVRVVLRRGDSAPG